LQAAVTQQGNAHMDDQQIVEQGRCLMMQYRTHGEEVDADKAGIGGGRAQSAEVLGDSHVAVGQVVPVEYDALRVDLGPAHPQRGAETEILSLHAAVLSPAAGW